MPAPSIVLSRGAITLTMTPIPKNGYEIRGSISQPADNADWTISLSLFKADPAAIGPGDETATFSLSSKVPFNEAPDEPSVAAKMQGLVNHVFDNFVPSP